MASGLIQNYNSAELQRANVLTNRNIIKVLVEDEYDIPFWYDVLNYCIDTELDAFPYKFEIITFHTNTGASANGDSLNNTAEVQVAKGKKHLLKLQQQLGKYLILCVDSDYDYLLDDISSDAVLINTHPYILQTYTYSIENYLVHSSTLEAVCVDSASVSVIPFNFFSFLKEYSEIIYPLLVWSLWLEKKEYGINPRTLPRTTACKLMTVLDSVIKQGEEKILSSVKKKVDQKLTELESNFPEYISEVTQFGIDMQHKLLTKENAYLFVRGHNIYQFILKSLIEPVCLKAKLLYIKEIKQFGALPDSEQSSIDRVNNLQKNSQHILDKNFRYKQKADAVIYHNLLKPAIKNLLEGIRR